MSGRVPPGRYADRAEAGSATVWACGLLFVLACTAAVPLALAAVVHARHRAEAAADLAALAAARRVVASPAAACEDAERVARAQAIRLLSCEVGDLDVTVAVAVPLPGPLGRFGDATARARAGPVTIDDRPPPRGS